MEYSRSTELRIYEGGLVRFPLRASNEHLPQYKHSIIPVCALREHKRPTGCPLPSHCMPPVKKRLKRAKDDGEPVSSVNAPVSVLP